MDGHWRRTSYHTPQAPISIRLHLMTFAPELFGTLWCQCLTDELRPPCQRRIILPHLNLGDDGRDFTRMPRSSQCILERLLNHVPDPSGSRGDQHAERQRIGFAARDLVANELVADLWSIPVDDADVPAIAHEI